MNEVNSTGDTLRDSTQEIQGPGDILGDYVEPEVLHLIVYSTLR